MAQIPLREGLFTERIHGDLLGFRCKTCERILPPLTRLCPVCFGERLEKLALSSKGILYSYTLVHQPHKRFKVPYAVGYITLPEGIRFFSPLIQIARKPFRVGMEMKLKVDKLWEEDGNEVVGPKFQPV